MLSDIVGTSVLTFSGVAEALGWAPTAILVVGLFPLSLYVSVLMARTRRLLAGDPLRPDRPVGTTCARP